MSTQKKNIINQFQNEDITLFNAIKDFQNGNSEKATIIYESTKKYAYRMIYQHVSRFKNQNVLSGDVNSITEDVMQELYLDFFKTIDKFRNEDPKSLYKWISIVSNRMVLKYVDKNKMEILQGEQNEDFTEDRDIWDSSNISDDDLEGNREIIPDAALEDKEFQKLILDFVQSLPEVQAQTVMYHFYSGMKYQEIADVMGVSLITVKTRMRKAQDSLKEIVSNYEKKSGTKLHSVSLLPLLGIFYRVYINSATVPAAMEVTALSIVQKVVEETGKSVVTSTADATVKTATAKAVSVKVIVAALATTVVVGTGVGIAIQQSNKPEEVIVEKNKPEEEIIEEDTFLEGHHYLIWNEEVTDITEYVYEAEFQQSPDGTYNGVYITTDDVLLEMGFTREFDEIGNPYYTLGDFCISYHMGTQRFGLGPIGTSEEYVYGVDFFEQDGKYYVDSRLALKLLAIDGYISDASYSEFTMQGNTN